MKIVRMLKNVIIMGVIFSLVLGTIPVSAQDLNVEENLNQEKVESVQEMQYLFIESPYIATPDTQHILVSLGENAGVVTEATLTYQVGELEEQSWPMTSTVEGAILFSKEFADENQSGIYSLKSLFCTIDGVEKTIDLEEAGIEGKFGVNQTCETKPDAVLDETSTVTDSMISSAQSEEGTTRIMSLDESGNASEVNGETQSVLEQNRNRMKKTGDVKIVLDPGHDSSHKGASSGNLREEELTLKIAQYCYNELIQYPGVEVYMTRQGMACANGSDSCLGGRVNYAKSVNADFFVSIHLNSSEATSAHGAEVYYPTPNYRPDLGLEGEALAKRVAAELEKLGLFLRQGDGIVSENGDGKYPDGSWDDNFYVIRECKKIGIPAILIEHAFMSNSSDVNLCLNSEAGLRSLGIADANAIIQYYGLVKGRWEWDINGWWFQYANGNRPSNTWAYIGGKWYHFNTSGYMDTGWLSMGLDKYYLNPNGDMAIGWKWIDTAWYLFDKEGQMIIDWYWDAESQCWYYLNYDGSMRTGWLTLGATTYFFDKSGKAATGNQVINGVHYSFTDRGVLIEHNGWNEVGGKKYYVENGVKVLGWKWISVGWYHFSEDNGILSTGWKWIDTAWYYLEPTTGKMATGWLTESGEKYYMKSNGAMVTGRITIDGTNYIFNSNGSLRENEKIGWQEDSKGKYYYVNGNKVTGWKWIDVAWYYFNPKTGAMATNWIWADTAWFYLEPSTGKMKTGWLTESGNKYYLKSNGEMVKEDYTVDGVLYEFNISGVLQGTVKDGWHESIDGKCYYMDGKRIVGWKWIGTAWYLFNSTGIMETDWVFIDSAWYYLNPATGTMYRGWLKQNNQTYYLFSNGIMAKGWQTIEGVYCYFNDSGELKSQGVTNIMGSPKTTVEQMVRYFKNSKKEYPGIELGIGGAPTIDIFCTYYMLEAQKEGVRPEVAFAQAMNETGFLKFGGIIEIGQFNFAGIGATDTDGHVNKAWFPDVVTGIRAQIQHLKAYGSTEPLVGELCDPRFNLVKRGVAPYVEYLGIKENPKGAGWATSQYYGITMVNEYLNKLLKS